MRGIGAEPPSIAIDAPADRIPALHRALGHEVRPAGGGGKPDCLLVLHDPPRVDGVERVRQRLRDRSLPEVPLVLVADQVDRALRRAALAAGAMDVVALATLRPGQLCEVIEEAILRLERVEAERSVLDAILEAVPAGILVADARGELVRSNPAAEAIWGPLGSRVAPRESAISRALRGESARGDILEIEPHDHPGERLTVLNSGAPVRDGAGRVVGAVVAQMDISALVAAEAALRESESRFRALADNIPQLAWMADENGEIFWFNRRWFEFTGTTHRDMVGWGWTKIHHPDHLARVVETFRRHVELGEPWEDTFPMRSATGEFRWFLTRAVPIRDETGRVTRWFGTNTDVTEQREAEEALREADRRKDEFIAILAHELRNPLAPVRSAVEVLGRLVRSEPRVDRVREVIARQVAHMARLIDDLLDVSRIARGKLSLQRQRCDLAAIARQTAEDYRASLEAAGLTLVLTGAQGELWVDGDPVRLAQMVGNLLHNAIRFTEPGGTVEVRAGVDAASRVAVVSVRDTGVGIDPALLSRLFDPFSQADQDLARSKGGLGLGLSLTKGLAELHGGGVAADSAGPGRGSTFSLRLPLARAREAARSQGPGSYHGEGLRILVVEDNHDAAETLGTLLELDGHEVRLAFDGEAAVPLAREFRPDVVISDLGLPGQLDGYAVARELRADPEFAQVYFIALSGYANEDARRRSRLAGFDVHLAKPADIERLEELLAQVAGRTLV